MRKKYHIASEEACCLAGKCKKLRKERGWSTEVAAEKAGISVDGYKDVEGMRHEPSLSKIVALARAYGISTSELLDERTTISEEVYKASYALGKALGIK